MPTITVDHEIVNYTLRPARGEARVRILYIHGNGCNGRVFDRHITALDPAFAAATIDLPGHGQSGGPGYRGVADYAAACSALIGALGWADCVVAGHSMGGGVALALTLYDPERVRALLMIDSGARLRVSPQVISAAREIAAGARRARPDPRYGFAAATSDEIVAAVRSLTADCAPAVIARDWIAGDACDFMSRLAGIDIPTLAVCGREDQLTPPKYHEYLAATMPNCELAIIDNAGHWPFAEQPQVFDQTVERFLRSLASPR